MDIDKIMKEFNGILYSIGELHETELADLQFEIKNIQLRVEELRDIVGDALREKVHEARKEVNK